MEDYTQLKALLIASGQTAAYSDTIIKSIDKEQLFETLSEMPIDEVITCAYLDNDSVAEYNAAINRAIERLKKALV